MTETEIIESLRTRLYLPSGRHLYGVLGTYAALDTFGKKLQQAKDSQGNRFPKPISVNRGILDSIPDDEFKALVEDEAKRPEPTAAHVARAFEEYLRAQMAAPGLLVLSGLEMVFAYRVEMTVLRTIAADEHRVLLLLPGKRSAGQIVLFPELDESSY